MSGYVALRLGDDVRRIPFWGHVRVPASLCAAGAPFLTKTGIHTSTTRGHASTVSRYLYPERPDGLGIAGVLNGPESVFRVRIARPVENFGVVITHAGKGVAIEPRVVRDCDPDRLTGYAALPIDTNPYLPTFHEPVPASGALRPDPGTYAVVFDTKGAGDAGPFRFRYWMNDVTPPTAKLLTPTVRSGADVLVRVTDTGSGVYAPSLAASLGAFLATSIRFAANTGVVRIATRPGMKGRFRLRLRVSDYQETRNNENVRDVLPNTRFFTAVVTLR